MTWIFLHGLGQAPLYGLMSDIIGGSQHVISSFTGKPENHMGDNFDASFVKIQNSCIIDRQWIASPDVSSCLRMD